AIDTVTGPSMWNGSVARKVSPEKVRGVSGPSGAGLAAGLATGLAVRLSVGLPAGMLVVSPLTPVPVLGTVAPGARVATTTSPVGVAVGKPVGVADPQAAPSSNARPALIERILIYTISDRSLRDHSCQEPTAAWQRMIPGLGWTLVVSLSLGR